MGTGAVAGCRELWQGSADRVVTTSRYYSGEKKAPVLTIFIGGNHEASNHLQELPYGGWVAPSIYYLGTTSCPPLPAPAPEVSGRGERGSSWPPDLHCCTVLGVAGALCGRWMHPHAVGLKLLCCSACCRLHCCLVFATIDWFEGHAAASKRFPNESVKTLTLYMWLSLNWCSWLCETASI